MKAASNIQPGLDPIESADDDDLEGPEGDLERDSDETEEATEDSYNDAAFDRDMEDEQEDVLADIRYHVTRRRREAKHGEWARLASRRLPRSRGPSKGFCGAVHFDKKRNWNF